jgi:hypothetical protein
MTAGVATSKPRHRGARTWVSVLALSLASALGASTPVSVPASGLDSTQQLEAEIEVALSMLRDLRQAQNQAKPSPADPAELATVDRQMREFVARRTAPGGSPDDRQARLEKMRDLLIDVLNENAATGAKRQGLPVPPPTTVETLRAAVKARK